MSRLPTALLLAASFVLGGCGAAKTTTSDDASVRAALTKWAATTSPAAACEQISRGFKLFLSEGETDKCASRLPKKLKLTPQKLVIHRVRFEDHQALVDAEPVGHPKDATTWYFIKVGTSWQLNSIGVNVGAPPPGGLPDPPKS